MGTTQPPDGPDPSPAELVAPDPSMEDILASIRRILNEEPAEDAGEDTLLLDPSMLADPPPPPPPLLLPPVTVVAEPVVPSEALLSPAAVAQASASVSVLLRELGEHRNTAVSHAGPTIEDLVREEIRPLLKQWLETHLPPLVERVVRDELARVIGRAGGMG